MAERERIGDLPGPKRAALCNTCTIQLVRLAYRNAPWFRLVREPLRVGMRALAAWHRVDPNDYEVRTRSCRGCIRFYKVALKERSATFRWLNERVNPLFDLLLERIVPPTVVLEAQAYAKAATAGELPPDESETKEER